ncbi:ribose-phosphate pyrophosphokinase [Oceanicola sp. 22II-s10i]|uniref:phosphonate metabolism protein/1,5-bisphosphokinase (PRPP-forming) PhnN n=1 Tax=Oceanicola sp. 22II-s10i TaxID=1317116 RepID=UPI000B52330A|nr:phosphonate metabolism protein/1,5-bisphosphokinase (PRPP-forming) PhnN [Oceanicola sp. 22II-s10i]OWU85010.1 ribose-phosphate pyrophosphokinase [Oceanicola sp. 22II-s10i]
MRGGRLFTVVGPSGAGKDTLIEAVRRRRPDLVIVRRAITRGAEKGGEPFEPVTEPEFTARAMAGGFAIHWRAHGLSYGIPARIDRDLAEGRDVLFNGSRAVLPQVAARYPELTVLLIDAPREVLAARLAARNREDPADIAARLARSDYALPEGLNVVRIDNGGTLETAVEACLAALQPVSA